MFFFILQSLFWFLLALSAGYFLGRWLKHFLCNCNVPVDNQTDIAYYPSNTKNRLKIPTKTDLKPTVEPTASADSSYDAMINKLSSKDNDTSRSSLNVANISAGAAAATLGTAAYTALKATGKDTSHDKKPSTHADNIKEPSSLAFDSIDNTKHSPDKTISKTLGEKIKDGKTALEEKVSDSKTAISDKLKDGKAILEEKISDSRTTISDKLKDKKATLEDKVNDSKTAIGAIAAGVTDVAASKPATSTDTYTKEIEDKIKDAPKTISKTLGERLKAGKATLDEKVKDTKTAIEEKASDSKAAISDKLKDGKATLSEKIKDTKIVIEEKASDSKAAISDKLKDGKATLSEKTKDSKTAIEEKASDSKTAISDKLKDSKATIGTLATGVIGAAASSIKAKPATSIDAYTEETKDKIKASPKTIGKTLGERLKAGKATLDEKIKDSKETISEKIKDGKTAIEEKASNSKTAISDKLKDSKATFSEKIKGGKSALEEKASDRKTTISDKLKDGKATLSEKVKDGKTALGEKASNSKATIAEKIKDNKAAISVLTAGVTATVASSIKEKSISSTEINEEAPKLQNLIDVEPFKTEDKTDTFAKSKIAPDTSIKSMATSASAAIAASSAAIKPNNTDSTITKRPSNNTPIENLQIIEGIGPTLEKFLHDKGITTWKSLSLQSENDLRTLLDSEDGVHKGVKAEAEDWIEQARLAATGQFADLVHLQKIDGSPSKLERKFSFLLDIYTNTDPQKDDLTRIMGIEAKIITLLNDADIHTFKELSDTPINVLQKILDDAGSNFQEANPETWSEQANLADKKEWDKLKSYNSSPK